MSSKISFFNKSVIRSDLKRLWWASALETLFLFLFFAFPIMDSISKGYQRYAPDTAFRNSIIMSYGVASIMFAVIIPAALAIFLFSYLNSSKSVATMHGLPVKRSTFFFSHIAGGIILFTLPVLINTAILLIFHAASSAEATFRLMHLLMWTVMFLTYALLAFSGTTAVTMITGSNVAALILTGAIAVLPFLTEEFIYYFCQQQLYGYYGSTTCRISSFLYVMPDQFWNGPYALIKYMIFAAILLAAALCLYRVRKLENNSEVLAFPKLRPIFVYCAALYIGGFGYLYLNEIWQTNSILLFIPLGVIGIIAAEMLMKKSFRVKSAVKPALIFSAAVCLVALGFRFDIAGYERRIPSVNSVKSVELRNNVSEINSASNYYTNNGKEITYNDEGAVFTSGSDIENIIALHRDLIENRNYEPDDNLTIVYTLSNGSKLERSYHINLTQQKSLLKPVIESKQMREAYLPILKDIDRNIVNITISDERLENAITIYADDVDKIDKIMSALKSDAVNTGYDSFARRNAELTHINISYKRPGAVYVKTGGAVPEENLPAIGETYQIHNDYANSIALIHELGLYDKIRKSSDIEHITVNFVDRTYTGSGYTEYSEREYSEADITDPAKIAEVYNSLEQLELDDNNFTAILGIYFKDGESATLWYDRNQEGIPSVLSGR